MKCSLYSVCNYACLYLQRFANENAYYVVKELLMTERTYKKDLEVIAVVSYVIHIR